MAVFSFYLFAIVAVVSGVLVIFARNPVHSVLWLILAFFSAAGLFVLLGAEFVAMLLVIVYVGAVAVLFLFVVMMLDVDFVELRQGFLQYLPVGMLIGLVFLAELVLVLGSWTFGEGVTGAVMANTSDVSNTVQIGRVLYTEYVLFFQMAGLVLLVAMIGAIVLTLRHRVNVKRQSIAAQNMRNKAAAIDLVKVPSGKGL